MKSTRFHAALLALLCLCVVAPAAATAVSAEESHSALGGRPDGEAFLLPPILVPPSGSAAFYISEEIVQGVVSTTGLFDLMPPRDDVYTYRAVRVHYTVLSHAGESARLLVRAQPVHPETGLPIAPARWEATYVVTPDDEVFESGDTVPNSFERLVAPDWLADWRAVMPEELPDEPILPGSVWTGTYTFEADMAIDEDFPLLGHSAPVTATFVEWIDAGDFGMAARIVEELYAEVSAVRELARGVYADWTLSVDLAADHRLLEGDFPYGMEQWGTVYTVISLGRAGDAHIAAELAYSAVRDDPDEIWLPYEQRDAVEPGEVVWGMLGPWNETLEGVYVKAYAFFGRAGDAYDIYLNSPDFDAYLMLADQLLDVLATDDDSGGATDAFIRAELPYTGVYYIVVTTHAEGDEGLYTLEVYRASETGL